MRLFNLLSDPKEETDIKDGNPWAQSVMDKIVADFMATTERYPNVPPNAPDPYVPPAKPHLSARCERVSYGPRKTKTENTKKEILQMGRCLDEPAGLQATPVAAGFRRPLDFFSAPCLHRPDDRWLYPFRYTAFAVVAGPPRAPARVTSTTSEVGDASVSFCFTSVVKGLPVTGSGIV